MKRNENLAVAVGAMAISLPSLVARFPPMTDLPLHAAEVGLLAHFGDPRFEPVGLYQRNIGHPNQLFHLLSFALAAIVGVDWGCKLVVAAAQAGVIVFGARLAKYLGASPWAALLLTPIALGWFYHFGLVANLLGVVTLLAALPSIDRFVAAPTARSALRAMGWIVLLYLAHESALVVAALAVLIFTASYGARQGGKAMALRLLPMLFAGTLVAAQLFIQKHIFTNAGDAGGDVIWRSPLTNLLEYPHLIAGLADGLFDLALFVVTVLAAAAFAIGRRDGATVTARRFVVVGAACLIASLVFPFGLAHGTLFSQRFFAPGFALIAIALAARRPSIEVTRLQAVLASAVTLAFVAVTAPEIVDADRQNRDVDRLIAHMEPGAAIAYIEADKDKGGRAYAVSTLAARAVAERGGRAMLSFSDSPIAPVLMRPEHLWPESLARMHNNTIDFAPAHDLKLFRYVFVHSYNPVILDVAPAILAEATRVDRVGEWSLFESKLPTIALTDAEPPWPAIEPETFRIRAIRELRALGNR